MSSNPHNLYVTGRRVALRPVEPSEAVVFAQWLNDERVRVHLENYRPLSYAVEAQRLHELTTAGDSVLLGITIPGESAHTRTLIGACGLHGIHPRDRRATFGIFIGDPANWSQGFGGEATRLMLRVAFDLLNLHRVELHVHDDNEKGLRAYQRAGFVKEGRLREHHWRNGAWSDVIVMSVLADKWRKDRRAESGEPRRRRKPS